MPEDFPSPSPNAAGSSTTLDDIKALLVGVRDNTRRMEKRLAAVEEAQGSLPSEAKWARAPDGHTWAKESTHRQYKESLHIVDSLETASRKLVQLETALNEGAMEDGEAVADTGELTTAIGEAIDTARTALYSCMKDCFGGGSLRLGHRARISPTRSCGWRCGRKTAEESHQGCGGFPQAQTGGTGGAAAPQAPG